MAMMAERAAAGAVAMMAEKEGTVETMAEKQAVVGMTAQMESAMATRTMKMPEMEMEKTEAAKVEVYAG